MKTIIGLVLLLISTVIYGQNGGQYAENSSVKITQLVSTIPGKVVIQVTNKQSCSADIRISYDNEHRVKSIYSIDTFQITIPSNGKVRAKAETNCGFADYGQVELNLNASLPISYVNLSGRWINDNTIQLYIKVGEVTGNNSIKIQIKGYEPLFVNINEEQGSDKTYVLVLKYQDKWIITQKYLQ